MTIRHSGLKMRVVGPLIAALLLTSNATPAAPPDQKQATKAQPQPAQSRLERAPNKAARPAPRTDQMTGPPVAVGGPKPQLRMNRSVGATHSLGQPGTIVVHLISPDNPTAYRMANSIRELQTAQWKAFEGYPAFTPNGLFPAQVVAQVGKPVGPGVHPVHGALVRSDPVILQDRTLNKPEHWLKVYSWRGESAGRYINQPGELALRLQSLGADTRNIKVSNLSICNGTFVMDGQPLVGRATDPGFHVRANGMFKRQIDSCTVTMDLLGDGGNFDPGVLYAFEGRIPNYSVGMPPRVTVAQTYGFRLRPRFQFDTVQLTTSPCTSGETSDGKFYVEATSGPFPSFCAMHSPELLLPKGVQLEALHWKVQRIYPGTNTSFHCSYTDSYPRKERRFWYQMVSEEKADYFHVTQGPNPMLPGDLAPDVNADLSVDRERQWVLPLKLKLGCSPYVGNNGNGGPGLDRIRLVLDAIVYRADSGTPLVIPNH